MKKIEKILLIFFSIVGIVFSICVFAWFLHVPIITDALFKNENLVPKLEYIFAGYNTVIGLVFFTLILIAVFIPNKSNILIIKKPKGEIRFSKKTIESTARYSFSDLTMISYSEVTAKFYERSEKAIIQVTLSLNGTSDLVAVTELVQNRVESALHASLGVDTQEVIIKVVESKQDYKNNFSLKEDIAAAQAEEAEQESVAAYETEAEEIKFIEAEIKEYEMNEIQMEEFEMEETNIKEAEIIATESCESEDGAI